MGETTKSSTGAETLKAAKKIKDAKNANPEQQNSIENRQIMAKLQENIKGLDELLSVKDMQRMASIIQKLGLKPNNIQFVKDASTITINGQSIQYVYIGNKQTDRLYTLGFQQQGNFNYTSSSFVDALERNCMVDTKSKSGESEQTEYNQMMLKGIPGDVRDNISRAYGIDFGLGTLNLKLNNKTDNVALLPINMKNFTYTGRQNGSETFSFTINGEPRTLRIGILSVHIGDGKMDREVNFITPSGTTEIQSIYKNYGRERVMSSPTAMQLLQSYGLTIDKNGIKNRNGAYLNWSPIATPGCSGIANNRAIDISNAGGYKSAIDLNSGFVKDGNDQWLNASFSDGTRLDNWVSQYNNQNRQQYQPSVQPQYQQSPRTNTEYNQTPAQKADEFITKNMNYPSAISNISREHWSNASREVKQNFINRVISTKLFIIKLPKPTDPNIKRETLLQAINPQNVQPDGRGGFIIDAEVYVERNNQARRANGVERTVRLQLNTYGLLNMMH